MSRVMASFSLPAGHFPFLSQHELMLSYAAY